MSKFWYLLLQLWMASILLRSSHAQRRVAGNMLADEQRFLYLMERPAETLFFPKGERDEVVFQVPQQFLPKRFQPLAASLGNRFGQSSLEIDIPPMTLPDISLSLRLPRNESFSTFVPLHRQMASRLIEVFLGMGTFREFLQAAALCRDTTNPELWTYAVSVALTHRNDSRRVDIPPLTALFPEKFMDGMVFRRARADVQALQPQERIPIEIPRDYTATDVEVEHRVAYFREDMGINLHHWTWHLVYPFGGPQEVVAKDRRGELFYYQHQQIIARYDFERLSNKLGRVRPYSNWQEPLEEGYFPKLDSLVASRVWPARSANTMIRNVQRDEQELVYDIQDLERWRDRIYQAIHEGRVLNERGQYVDLNNPQGIDILGNIVEASSLSINTNLYGNLHNLGHFAISICHDPDHRHLESFGVMGDLATAMRDPSFYRFHKFVDNMFQQHKSTQPRYTDAELAFNGVSVLGLEVVLSDNQRNELRTFWQKSDVELSRGLDIQPRGAIFARITHLQHIPFTYRIVVRNNGQPRVGTVRIFMAPKFDERGVSITFRNQRLMFIEMDRFEFNLRNGENLVVRNSTQSSVTIPYERTFRKLDPTQITPSDSQFNYCGCGWPQHMLVPKGSAEGLPAQLFVMVSNNAEDRVNQPPPSGCQSGYSYCGFLNRRYPDRRSMGYPFDRLPRLGAVTLSQFLTPNMRFTDITIWHENRVEVRGASLPPARAQPTQTEQQRQQAQLKEVEEPPASMWLPPWRPEGVPESEWDPPQDTPDLQPPQWLPNRRPSNRKF